MQGITRSSLGIALTLLAGAVSAAEIEEIIVTAEKRESALQETPVAISAVTRDTIEKQNIIDLAQVQFIAPGLVFNEIADMAQITMRGIGVDISEMQAEPGVALHADGVYRGGLTSSRSLLFDLERIEVLRGPQGTLYGRNSTGGSINVISRLPGDEYGYDVGLLYGDYNRVRIDLSGDAPVSDRLKLRGAFAYDNRTDGYVDNDFTGNDEWDQEAAFFKGAAVFTPTENLEGILRFEYTSTLTTGSPAITTDDHPVPPFLLSVRNPGGVLTIPGFPLFTLVCGAQSCADALGLNLSPPGVGSDDPFDIFSDGKTTYDRNAWGTSLTLTWDLNDDISLRSITSYFEIEQDALVTNNDGVDITYLTDDFNQKNEEISQEFTLSGRTGDFDWIGGVYFYRSEIEEVFLFTLPALQPTFEALFGILSSFDPATGLPNGAPLPPGTLAFFGNRLDGSMAPFPFLDFSVDQELTSVAAYGQTTYHVNERLRATAGLRWTRDKKDVTQSVVNNLGGDFCLGLGLNKEFKEVTGKVGLDADVGEDSLVYFTFSRGFKAGGLNTGTCGNTFDPEIILAYEIGAKSRFFDNTLQVNAAAFYNDYQDLQARLFINNASIVQNAADARTFGVEVEALWLASERFRLDGALSYLNAEFDDFVSTDPLNPQVGFNCNPVTLLDCQQQLKGNKLLRAPEFKVSASAEYDIPADRAGLFTLRAEYAYTDEVYHTVFNNDFAKQDGFSLVNLRLIWTPSGDLNQRLRVIGFVENVGDIEYAVIHAPNATTGGTLSQFGPPRTWGIQMRYSGGR